MSATDTDATADRSRYARARDALENFDSNGYLMYLELEIDEQRSDGLTDNEEHMVEVLNEWKDECRKHSGPANVSEFQRWLDYKQYEDYLPTVETDISRHVKCLGCGADNYTYQSRGGCSCPVGNAEETWYDCLDCDEEYLSRNTPDCVPLCKDCFRDRIRQVASAT